MVNITTKRLVDYYVEVSTTRGENNEQIRSISRRIPEKNHSDFPLPDGVPYFCIPSSLEVGGLAKHQRNPTFFTFSLTGSDGERTYGSSLLYYAPIKSNTMHEICPKVEESEWRPRVLCLLSHYPYFSLFKSFITWIFRSLSSDDDRSSNHWKEEVAEAHQLSLLSPRYTSSWSLLQSKQSRQLKYPTLIHRRSYPPITPLSSIKTDDRVDHEISLLEHAIRNFVSTTASPPPGVVLDVSVFHQSIFRYQRNEIHGLPHVDESCFNVLFQCLSARNVTYLVNCLLLEQRVLIHSMHLGLLTPTCEALCSLLFPFTWEHVYIPLLPIKLIDYLQAPVPYLMGVHTGALSSRTVSEIFASCVVVHLDKDKVVSPIHSRLDHIPVEESITEFPNVFSEKIIRIIKSCAPMPYHSSVIDRPLKLEDPSKDGKRVRTRRKAATAKTSQDLSEMNAFAKTIGYQDLNQTEETEVMFGPGPLGITFESTRCRLLAANNFEEEKQQSDISAVVKAFPKLSNGLPGPAEASGSVFLGSYLIAINGKSTLHMSFKETMEALRLEKRPMRLRFQNSILPHDNACTFIHRLKAASVCSIFPTSQERYSMNQLKNIHTIPTSSNAASISSKVGSMNWILRVRLAFLEMYTRIFLDYQRFLCIEHKRTLSQSSSSSSLRSTSSPASPTSTSPVSSTSRRPVRRNSFERQFSIAVSFDRDSFLSEAKIFVQEFLSEFTNTQAFHAFINDAAYSRMVDAEFECKSVQVLNQCIHLLHDCLCSFTSDLIDYFFDNEKDNREPAEDEIGSERNTSKNDSDLSRTAKTDTNVVQWELLESHTTLFNTDDTEELEYEDSISSCDNRLEHDTDPNIEDVLSSLYASIGSKSLSRSYSQGIRQLEKMICAANPAFRFRQPLKSCPWRERQGSVESMKDGNTTKINGELDTYRRHRSASDSDVLSWTVKKTNNENVHPASNHTGNVN